MKKLSIVIPCYFNELNIPITYQVLKTLVLDVLNQVDLEIIFVDDGSKDQTLNELKKLQTLDSRIKVVKLSRNFGEFRAILAGISKASGEAIAVMSADLQDPPHLIVDMFHAWEAGEKLVIAARSNRTEPTLKKFLANSYYWFLRKLVLNDFPPQGFDFFLIDRQVANLLLEMQEKNSSIYVQLIWTGFAPKIIEYVRQERDQGKSMWTYAKRINLFIDTFIVFSYKPIRFISGLGILMSLLGFISALYFIFEKIILKNIIEGWTSMIVVTLIVAGVQMIMLGIIGEYLWRNLDESRKRPLYIIDEIYENKIK